MVQAGRRRSRVGAPQGLSSLNSPKWPITAVANQAADRPLDRRVHSASRFVQGEILPSTLRRPIVAWSSGRCYYRNGYRAVASDGA